MIERSSRCRRVAAATAASISDARNTCRRAGRTAATAARAATSCSAPTRLRDLSAFRRKGRFRRSAADGAGRKPARPVERHRVPRSGGDPGLRRRRPADRRPGPARSARGRRARRRGGTRKQALCNPDPADAAVRRAGASGGGGHVRASSQAARGRGARRLPERGQVVAAAAISNAKPKVADYPFTTLAPVLGTVESPDGRQLTVADVPGLIEGASEGVGLGHEFLAHLERARLLLHVIDVGEDVAERFAAIDRELEQYGAGSTSSRRSSS